MNSAMRLFALPMVGFFFMAILQVARGQGFAPSPAPTNLPPNDGMSIFMHNFTICGGFFPPLFPSGSIPYVIKLKILIGNLFFLSNAGTAIDQGIAYVLLLVALAITYLIH
ncbi:hypothetical protein RHSIM_Rhsim03G0243700 [Rhododendron simsii]|uniref:Uncharacterized protein n=1 Tax=Rhododendron simsii TaxID=118357 RepID=A0A834H9D6_RHOSS|nr:hypothetical protein RHSIM_Rhsim03G0243700 [Rhododendron simsii]